MTLANRLLFSLAKSKLQHHLVQEEARLQFTIESRQLTMETTRRSSMEVESSWTTIEAADPDDAISQFVHSSEAQLVSFLKPGDGRESIATVRKNDSVFLVRIYEA